jgi:hypothetical protein
MDFDGDALNLKFDLTADPLAGEEHVVETTEQLPAPARYDRRRIARRQYINGLKKQALTALIVELPPPDVDVYILSNGSGSTYKTTGDPLAFEFGHFIPVLVGMLGGHGVIAYVSTWTMNRQHSLNLLQMVDTGELAALAVMTDPYFLRRESAVANQLVTGLLARGQRFVAFKNHVKACALSSADGSRVVSVLGSANLSSQPRAENFTVSCDPGLYAFLRDQFFEEMSSRD